MKPAKLKRTMMKKSAITMLVFFALGMPLMASGQSQRMERRPKKG